MPCYSYNTKCEPRIQEVVVKNPVDKKSVAHPFEGRRDARATGAPVSPRWTSPFLTIHYGRCVLGFALGTLLSGLITARRYFT